MLVVQFWRLRSCSGVEIAADDGGELGLGIIYYVFDVCGGFGFCDVSSFQRLLRW
jgi:hypothetical protein